MASPELSGRDWRRDLRAYLDRRMIIILLLGFSSGLPFSLSFVTLSVWLREIGVSRTEIGFFALVSMPYSWKFLWAPIIDRVPIPGLSRRLGQRRSWALVAQAGLMASIVWLGSLDPATELLWMAVAAFVVVFMAASQDIVVDAYRIEILDDDEQAMGGAMIQYGYRVGMLVSSAGALYLSGAIPWNAVYAIEAALLIVGMVTILSVGEPPAAGTDFGIRRGSGAGAWLREVVADPFADFMRRPSWLLILAFVLLYRFPDSFVAIMANVFYVDVGFSNAEIANVSKIFGLAAILSGVFLGSLMVRHYGVLRGLLICGVVQVFSNLMYVAMALAGDSMPVFAATIAIENVSSGMGSAAFVGYLSSLCSPGFAGTQYALLSAVGTSGRNIFSAFTGLVADRLGWVVFFLTSTAVGLPALGLLLWLMQRAKRSEGPGAETA